MFQCDLDEISIIEKNYCIDSIIGMMVSFEISLDDIAMAFARCQGDDSAAERSDAGIALDMG